MSLLHAGDLILTKEEYRYLKEHPEDSISVIGVPGVVLETHRDDFEVTVDWSLLSDDSNRRGRSRWCVDDIVKVGFLPKKGQRYHRRRVPAGQLKVGDLFSHEEIDYVVTGIQQNGYVRTKPVGGGTVRWFAPHYQIYLIKTAQEKFSYTEEDWRRTYSKPGGIGTAMSPTWLLNGCPICGCKSWQVTSDCWAYCDGCGKGIPTDYPFTESGEIISHLGPEGGQVKSTLGVTCLDCVFYRGSHPELAITFDWILCSNPEVIASEVAKGDSDERQVEKDGGVYMAQFDGIQPHRKYCPFGELKKTAELMRIAPAWVEDEDIWERAKKEVDRSKYPEESSYWAVVTTVYKNMGGKVKKKEAQLPPQWERWERSDIKVGDEFWDKARGAPIKIVRVEGDEVTLNLPWSEETETTSLDDLLAEIEGGEIVPSRSAAVVPVAHEPWKITQFRGGIAIEWTRPGASIRVEKQRSKTPGLGGERYVVRVGTEEYGALTLEGAQAWADEAQNVSIASGDWNSRDLKEATTVISEEVPTPSAQMAEKISDWRIKWLSRFMLMPSGGPFEPENCPHNLSQERANDLATYFEIPGHWHGWACSLCGYVFQWG